ncbi:MAG TPA: 8-amino-7-oxononanoate synthase [Candidatus Obscuribacterales bacterium]
MRHLLAQISQQLLQRQSEGRLRQLRNIMPGTGAQILVDRRPLINFASNDYLGLSNHPALSQRSIEFTQRYGTGSTGSRLICGNMEPYEYIERKLASLKGTEAALILPSGFQTNLTVLDALCGGESLLACDRLSHNSILRGAQTSGARWTRYEHNDFTDLDERLVDQTGRYKTKWIATESVFSMDGDVVDLPSLQKVATAHDAAIYLDEAHATGVMGSYGMGFAAGKAGVTVAMGTFSKAAGSFGGYIACSQKIKDYLINFCGGIIFSTALPPPVLGAIDAALDLIPTMEKQRQLLLSNAEHLRTKLHKLGIDTGNSASQIIPIIVGDDNAALNLSQHLQDGGIFAPAIRPPTVPDGTARVRLSLTVHHTSEHLERIVNLMRSWNAH